MNKTDKKKILWHLRRCWYILLESVPTFGAREGQLRASSLTYYTLFAIVPVLAMLFGVAKGFALDEWLKQFLSDRMQNHNEILERLYQFADTTLNQTRGGVVAGVGALMLFWSVVKVIGTIENAVNRVWQVKKNRTIFRKFTDYLSFLVIAPVLLVAASSATIWAAAYLKKLAEASALVNYSRPILEFMLQGIPYLIVWALFTFIYIFLPNTRVKFSAAMFGGIIAGTVYQVLQAGYFFVQIALSKYNVIYGSFSALPLFLVWTYLNWLILLFGVTLSYLYQNYDLVSRQTGDNRRSGAVKRLTALLLCAVVTKRFSKGLAPLSDDALADELGLSRTLTGELINRLTQSGVLVPVSGNEYDELCYIPNMPLEKMTVLNVLERYDDFVIDEEERKILPDNLVQVSEIIGDIREKLQSEAGKLPVMELLK